MTQFLVRHCLEKRDISFQIIQNGAIILFKTPYKIQHRKNK